MNIIDLSRKLSHGMTVYPGDPEVSIERVHTYEEHSWELRKMSFGSHTGTHVDAFSHMHPGSATLDEIPLERFMGTAAVVRAEDPWPGGVGLFFLEPVDESQLERILSHHPGFVGGPLTEPLERALLGEGVVTYTNLVNLDLIPPGILFTFIGLPLSIQGGDGSPVRAVAILSEKGAS